MTKLHRDIAMRLLECVQDEEFTDQATIKVTLRHEDSHVPDLFPNRNSCSRPRS